VWGWPPNMGKCLTLIEACDSLCQRTYPQPGLRPLAPPSAVPRQSVTEMPKPRNRLARFRWSHQAMEWSKESKVFVPYPIPKFEAARMMILPYFTNIPLGRVTLTRGEHPFPWEFLQKIALQPATLGCHQLHGYKQNGKLYGVTSGNIKD
jgi:hypothetical protein